MNDQFELTENHIKLLNHMYVEFDDGAYDGAPAVNIKRPYGNSSCVYDIYEILNGKEWDSEDDMPEELWEQLMKIHRETATALQIVLATKSFDVGVYEISNRYSIRSWSKLKTFEEQEELGDRACPNKDENGHCCPLHNLHCQYPDCEK